MVLLEFGIWNWMKKHLDEINRSIFDLHHIRRMRIKKNRPDFAFETKHATKTHRTQSKWSYQTVRLLLPKWPMQTSRMFVSFSINYAHECHIFPSLLFLMVKDRELDNKIDAHEFKFLFIISDDIVFSSAHKRLLHIIIPLNWRSHFQWIL